MSETRVPPAQCRDMGEVRHAVDRLDEQIVALLGERFRYMEAAARIKASRNAVRDENRKADVIEKVKVSAEKEGVPSQILARLYEHLVEESIAYEFRRFDEMRA